MFFEFGIKDFIDILLVAFLLYYTYKLMKASGSINVFTGILVFILIWLVVSQVLEMKLLCAGHRMVRVPDAVRAGLRADRLRLPLHCAGSCKDRGVLHRGCAAA